MDVRGQHISKALPHINIILDILHDFYEDLVFRFASKAQDFHSNHLI